MINSNQVVLEVRNPEPMFMEFPDTILGAGYAVKKAIQINSNPHDNATAKIYIDGKCVYSRLDTLLADFNARVDDVYSVAEQDLDYVAAISKTRINYIQENLNTPIYRYHETATKIRFSHLCRAKKAFVLEEFYHAANKSRGLANINQPVF
jgi:hypothetical protein